jgi:hypothetical protein
MNKNSVMTVLLTIEIFTVFVIGILMLAKNADYGRVNEENVALKARVEEMQKQADKTQKQLKAQEEAVWLAATASKVSRGIWEKRLQDCEQKQNDWAKSACGTKCALYVELADKCIDGMHELSVMAKEK